MVERHLDLAQHLARLVDEAPDLERLADVPLCIVCFRAAPPGVPEEELDDLNRRLGAALLADGRVFAGHDRVRRAGRAAAGDRELAHHRAGHRPVRRVVRELTAGAR